jgi:putative membrane protein
MILIAKWFINALAILGAAYLINGITVESFWVALVVALFFGLMNAVVRPILIVLTLPVTVITLGLFVFVINGFLFWSLGTIIQGFKVDSLWVGIAGAIVVSVFSWIGNRFIIGDKTAAHPFL